jgi:hypothetical protein
MKLPEHLSLKQSVNWLEDAIITLSGPALAISGIIAGVDLLTGGNMLKQIWWLSLAWAICLLLTLDFQVLSLGARAHKVYLSDKSGRRKLGELLLAVAIAAVISYVSIQMQSIIARSNSAGLDITTATAQLGINPIWLIWERSALVLVLIFMSGWFREERGERLANTPTITPTDEALKQLAEQVSILALSVTQITTTVTEVKTTVATIAQVEQPAIPERTGASEQAFIIDAGSEQHEQESFVANAEGEQGEQDTNTGERIKTALASNTALSDRELASLVGCSPSTANKWRRRIQQAA